MTKFQRILNLIFFIFMTGTSLSVIGAGAQTPPPVAQKTPQVTYNVVTTLPPSVFSYTSNSSETEELKKKFARPQRHHAVTASKNEGLKHILRILTQKQTTSVLLTFTQGESSSCQLHLAFVFTPKVVGKKKTTELTLTVSSTQPLESWQTELINTLLKRDSFLARHPFGVAGATGILGIMAACYLGYLGALKRLKEETVTLFKKEFNAYDREFFFELISPKKATPHQDLIEPTHNREALFDVSHFEIPLEAIVACIGISSPGIITALIEENKLTNPNGMQLRILIISSSQDDVIIAELNRHQVFLKQNNCVSFIFNGDFTRGSKKIVRICEDFFSKKFASTSEGEAQIIRYSVAWEEHYQHVERNFSNLGYLTHFPLPSEGWYSLGDPNTAETEIVIFPTSARILGWREQSWTPASFNIPPRTANIKRSIICMINDASVPYTLSGTLATRDTRPSCHDVINFRPDGKKLRFDDLFLTIEPTSSRQTRFLHYIASEQIIGHNSNLVDEANDTNNTMKLFTLAAPTSTLEASYLAAAAYVQNIHSPGQTSTAWNESTFAHTENFDSAATRSQTSYENAVIKGRIEWTNPTLETNAFQRFAYDILAALRVIDPDHSQNSCQTAPDKDLLTTLADLPEPSLDEHALTKYNLIFVDSKFMGAINETSQLNTMCANKGWQLIVFGKTTLSHNNNRFFANLYLDASDERYITTTKADAEPAHIAEYKDAILKIACTLQTNRSQIHDDQLEQSQWAYALPSTTVSAGAGNSTTFSTPLQRRDPTTEQRPYMIQEKPHAQNVFESLKLKTLSEWSPSFQGSENTCYDRANIIGLELNNLTSKANIIFANIRLKPAKKYVIFTQNEQSNIDSFLKKLTTAAKAQIFIVSNYAQACEPRNCVNITRVTGLIPVTTTHQITLDRLGKLLE